MFCFISDYFGALKKQAMEMQSTVVGSTYTRFGRTVCPGRATVLYVGFVSSGHYTHYGGGDDYLCLVEKPQYLYSSSITDQSWIYSTEYETNNQVFANTHNWDVPCAVCFTPKSSTMMMPGFDECLGSYSLEYKGYLMSGYSGHKHSGEYLCVDEEPEVRAGSQQDTNGGLLYFVTADCNASLMACGPYEHHVPLTCAVCSY